MSSVDGQGKNQNVKYPPVGRCIYCSDPAPVTGDEHIVPLSLGGRWILPDSSCDACARIINTGFERHVAQEIFGDIRVSLGLSSRRNTWRRTISVSDSATGAAIGDIPTEQLDLLAPFLVLPMPAALFGDRGHSGPPDWTLTPIQLRARKSGGPGRVRFPDSKLNVLAFLRLLAKIGHGYAVAHDGYGSFIPFLKDAILTGDQPTLYHHIGTGDHVPSPEGVLHRVDICDSQDGALIVAIRLFASLGAPTYYVVVGRRLVKPSTRAGLIMKVENPYGVIGALPPRRAPD